MPAIVFYLLHEMEGSENFELDNTNTTTFSSSSLRLAALGHRSDKPLEAQQFLAEFIANIKDLICKQASPEQLESLLKRQIYQKQNPIINASSEDKKRIRINIYRSIVNQSITDLLSTIPDGEIIPACTLKRILDTVEDAFTTNLGYKPKNHPRSKIPSDEEVTGWGQKNPGE